MSRIINRQRQLAEQGRLRLGYTVPATKRDGTPTTRPVRSETWVVTSHDREKVDVAAHLWGGETHEWEPMGNGSKQWRVITETKAIPAILPPGDPLSQSYEQWNKGGCVRRCNGLTEELSGSPCICLAQHGETWFELSPRQVCVSKSRLKVLLPDMPGLGAWRMETGSYYATDEIAGMVDTIRGAIGENVLVPVTLRIEPRTRVAGGQTKQFVVPVLELRGVTAGALLSGQAIETRALTTGNPESTTPLAIQATDPYAEWVPQVDSAEDIEALTVIWNEMRDGHELVGHDSTPTAQREAFVEYFKRRAAAIKAASSPEAGTGEAATSTPAASPPPAEPDAEGVYDAEVVDDNADQVWQQIVIEAGKRDMKLPDLEDDVATFFGGMTAGEASGAELAEYLKDLQGRGTEAGAA
jgi:hypothetical protein